MNEVNGNVIAISGIDTDIGKTWATGLLAKALLEQRGPAKVITQKMVQTGCQGVAEDILKHRQLMGLPLQPEDVDGSCCPYVFDYPASPHLAAALEQRQIDPEMISAATRKLQQRYELVLLEGAGGLLVPLTAELLLADYLQAHHYPLVLVTSARLGSINHTLLTLEACRHRSIDVVAVLYNRYPHSNDLIAEDTRQVLVQALPRYGYGCPLIDLPDLERESPDSFMAAVAAFSLNF
jgi:dethiobiotin synthetase